MFVLFLLWEQFFKDLNVFTLLVSSSLAFCFTLFVLYPLCIIKSSPQPCLVHCWKSFWPCWHWWVKRQRHLPWPFAVSGNTAMRTKPSRKKLSLTENCILIPADQRTHNTWVEAESRRKKGGNKRRQEGQKEGRMDGTEKVIRNGWVGGFSYSPAIH